MRIAWILGVFAAAALIGCSDDPYDPDAPAIDPDAPVVRIVSPARGAFAGDVATLVVTGTASDDTAVASVTVNGIAAALAGDGSWQVTIPLAPGTRLIHAVARDGQDNIGKESRAVVAGALAPIATAVPQAITAAISAQTFDAIGRGVTGFLQTGDLQTAAASLNPVIDAGDGPDCLYAQADVARLTVGGTSRVALTPQAGGLRLDVELDDVVAGLGVRYAVACFGDHREVTATARRIKVTGTLDARIERGAFAIALVDQDIELSGVDLDLGGLPGDIADLLRLDAALGPIIGWATERFVVPAVNAALDGLVNDTGTVDVLGTAVDIAVTPARIQLDPTGALVELDASLRAQRDAASPGYVYVANQVPAMSSRGFALAVADDAANQLLASFWAAGGLDRAFALTTGSYGQIGTLYDRVELSAGVPPFIDAGGGALRLTIGDLIATFKRGPLVATRISVNAEVAIQVVIGPDGKPRLDVGSPTTHVDVLDDGVDGSNALSNAQFEIIMSFALGRVIAVGSGFLGAIPLPSLGGVAVRNVAVTERTGYLVLDGDIQ
jgi:Glucodextranase, domain B